MDVCGSPSGAWVSAHRAEQALGFETNVPPVGTGVQSLALGSNYEWDPSPLRWKRSLKGGGDAVSGQRRSGVGLGSGPSVFSLSCKTRGCPGTGAHGAISTPVCPQSRTTPLPNFKRHSTLKH